MGAVHSTSGQGLQVLETELAASKRSLEDIQAQMIAERKAAKDSAEAGEARLKAQLSTAKISAAAADRGRKSSCGEGEQHSTAV